MDIQLFQSGDQSFSVFVGNNCLGQIWTKKNPFHTRNIYLTFRLSSYPLNVSQPLFSLLQAQLNAPLQVMVSSEEANLIAFLKSGGFHCVRRCYEYELTKDDLIHPLENQLEFRTSFSGSIGYQQCAELLYRQYGTKHELINPLTASFSLFLSALPETVLWYGSEEEPTSFAFIEENEIAYVGTTDLEQFVFFIIAIVHTLFSRYETIIFEADDNDQEATALKNIFYCKDCESFDTYLR